MLRKCSEINLTPHSDMSPSVFIYHSSKGEGPPHKFTAQVMKKFCLKPREETPPLAPSLGKSVLDTRTKSHGNLSVVIYSARVKKPHWISPINWKTKENQDIKTTSCALGRPERQPVAEGRRMLLSLSTKLSLETSIQK